MITIFSYVFLITMLIRNAAHATDKNHDSNECIFWENSSHNQKRTVSIPKNENTSAFKPFKKNENKKLPAKHPAAHYQNTIKLPDSKKNRTSFYHRNKEFESIPFKPNEKNTKKNYIPTNPANKLSPELTDSNTIKIIYTKDGTRCIKKNILTELNAKTENTSVESLSTTICHPFKEIGSLNEGNKNKTTSIYTNYSTKRSLFSRIFSFGCFS
ncbi:MAG: hypothetical protein Q8S21_05840 [Candidatus Paracaedibacteraceae bacterium]|nr:hypothetical protein [Candidatus Paracaedibacteraceae bacterium]